MNESVVVNEAILNGNRVKLSDRCDNDEHYLTIIVGSNGAGKSRLLNNIALSVSFNSKISEVDFLEPRNKLRDHEKLILLHTSPNDERLKVNEIGVKYTCKDTESFIWPLDLERNTSLFEAETNEHPNKVICISNGFFHKFSYLIESPFSRAQCKKLKHDTYKNLTLNRIIRQSSHTDNIEIQLLAKLLIKSFLRNDRLPESTLILLEKFGGFDGIHFELKVASQFDPLALYPYNFDYNDFANRIIAQDFELERTDFSDETLKLIYEKLIFLMNYLYENYKKKHNPQDIIEENQTIPFQHYLNSSFIKFHFDNKGHRDSNVAFSDEAIDAINFLGDFNILRTMKVNLLKCGNEIPIENLSSGEINIFLTLMLINSEIENKSIILIDEPEINLHPEWQMQVLPKIMDCFSHIKGCHFIAATHSPLVTSSIKENNSSLVILEQNNESTLLSGSEVKGKSADFQLFRALKFPGPHNEYIIRKLMTIIAKIRSGEDISDVDLFIVNESLKSTKNDDGNDTVRYLLKQVAALIS